MSCFYDNFIIIIFIPLVQAHSLNRPFGSQISWFVKARCVASGVAMTT